MSFEDQLIQLQESQNRAKALEKLDQKFSDAQLPNQSKLMDTSAISAQTIGSVFKNDSAVNELNNELKEQLKSIQSGDFKSLEEMLLTQSITLNSTFNKLLKQGNTALTEPSIMTSYPNLPESLVRLALKCQNQSRQTIQTLLELKNPKKPSQFIKNYVNQQLNELKVETKAELQQIGESTNAKVDIRGKSQTSKTYQEVEAMES